MCILLLSTAHPKYALIVLSNRDEYLHRATSRATFWPPPHTHILSGRDLARPERGTWLGITRQGRLAILTNFRESSSSAAISQTSRGAMVNAFLAAKPHDLDPEEWIDEVARSLLDGDDKDLESRVQEGRKELETKVGGFSLVCGIVRGDGKGGVRPLRVISNRDLNRRIFIPTTSSGTEGSTACEAYSKETNDLKDKPAYGLSNSLIDEPWPKVTIGEQLLAETIKASDGVEQEWSQDELLEHLFAVLSHDTFPMPESEEDKREKWGYKEQLEALRHSVFIPPFETATSEKPVEETPISTVSDKQGEQDSEGKQRSSSIALAQLNQPLQTVQPTSSNVSTHGSIASSPTLVHSSPSETHSSPATPQKEKPSMNQAMPGTEKSTVYGTQKQTVILIDHDGHVTYVERTLFDEDAKPLAKGEADVREEFDIEGW
ncbi:DUF833-domain-containing protein [Ascobolus immersus RN42]|uniref:DUF833-domain-containing protein n=1 Tax=Ascobolus immersus RN42 TaxID=1160509 RepID=A0A3N4HZJ3_ASCIM|nr:DUF833-domain-containing protein [Ascobolus immersus RN42]